MSRRAATRLVAALVVLGALWLARPAFHGIVLFFFVNPLVWFPPLAVLVIGALATGLAGPGDARARRRTLSVMVRHPRQGLRRMWSRRRLLVVMAGVLLLLGGLLNGPLVARSIYVNTVYRQIPSLPTGGTVRLVPREVAIQLASSGFNSPTERLTHFRIVRTPRGLAWTALRTPDGLVRAFTKKSTGLVSLEASTTERRVSSANARLEVAPGLRIRDNLRWRLLKERYLIELAEPSAIQDVRGRPLILVPYLSYKGLLVRRPVLGGAFVVHPDGQIEDLSPGEVRRRPEIARSGRLFPDELARRIQDAYAYKRGILNNFFLHEEQTQITDTESNPPALPDRLRAAGIEVGDGGRAVRSRLRDERDLSHRQRHRQHRDLAGAGQPEPERQPPGDPDRALGVDPRHRLLRRRGGDPGRQYALAYREAWSEPAVRWLFSTVPTMMVFDDHEIHAEWKISQAWADEVRRQPWYERRVTDGLMAYWLYQHLGNLSPDELVDSELFARVRGAGDGGSVLREFARDADREAGASRWSFCRDLGSSRLVVVDSRAGRELTPGRRRMIGEAEWEWVERQAAGDFDHLLLASSVPFLLGFGLHYLEAWNEAVCDGAWGQRAARLGEQIRRALVLDHWASFQHSFRRLVDLLHAVVGGELGGPPDSVLLLSGDVHHSYLAEIGFPAGTGTRTAAWQAVCSPYRKDLHTKEKLSMRFANSRAGAAIGRALDRLVGVPKPPIGWRLAEDPSYENHVATLDLSPGHAALRVETTEGSDWRGPRLRTEFERRLA